MIALPSIITLAGITAAFELGSASFFEAAAPINIDLLPPRCDETRTICGTSSCMPKGGTCCDSKRGLYCPAGTSCYSEGCCPAGKTCDGSPPGSCAAGMKACGRLCIPSASICCNATDLNNPKWCSAKDCDGNEECANARRSAATQTSSRLTSITSTRPTNTTTIVTTTTLSSSSSSSAAPVTTGTKEKPKGEEEEEEEEEEGEEKESSSESESDSESESEDESDEEDGGKKKKDEDNTPVATIVGGTIGSGAAVALLGVGGLLLYRRRRRERNTDSDARDPDIQELPPYDATSSLNNQSPRPWPLMTGAAEAKERDYHANSYNLENYPTRRSSTADSTQSIQMENVRSLNATYEMDSEIGIATASPLTHSGTTCWSATVSPATPAFTYKHDAAPPVIYEMSTKSDHEQHERVYELA